MKVRKSANWITVTDKGGAHLVYIQAGPKATFRSDGQEGWYLVGEKAGARCKASVAWDSYGAVSFRRTATTIKLQTGGKMKHGVRTEQQKARWIKLTNAYLKHTVFKNMKVS